MFYYCFFLILRYPVHLEFEVYYGGAHVVILRIYYSIDYNPRLVFYGFFSKSYKGRTSI